MSIEQNKNLVKQGHELAVLLGTQHGMLDAASLVQRLTAQLDVTTVAVREATKQRDALAAESVGLIEQAEEVYAAGYNHGHLNTVDGIAYADCVKDDFYGLAVELMREAETPATDAFLREVRADAILFASYQLPDGGKYQDSIQALSQEVRDGDVQVSFPVKQLHKGGAA